MHQCSTVEVGGGSVLGCCLGELLSRGLFGEGVPGGLSAPPLDTYCECMSACYFTIYVTLENTGGTLTVFIFFYG